MVQSGVYVILNLLNERRYVGSSRNMTARMRGHLHDLRKGNHGNQHLQRAFDKYGEEAFAFEILEIVENRQALIFREQHYLDQPIPKYNIARAAGSPMLGRRHSIESRRRMSEAQMGRRNHMYGQHHTEKARHKMNGRVVSVETRCKIRESLLKRWKNGEPHPRCGKFRSNRAKQRTAFAEVRKVNSNRGRPLSDEHRKNISKGLKRHWAQPEKAMSHRHAVSTAVKKYWAHRRQERAAAL